MADLQEQFHLPGGVGERGCHGFQEYRDRAREPTGTEGRGGGDRREHRLRSDLLHLGEEAELSERPLGRLDVAFDDVLGHHVTVPVGEGREREAAQPGDGPLVVENHQGCLAPFHAVGKEGLVAEDPEGLFGLQAARLFASEGFDEENGEEGSVETRGFEDGRKDAGAGLTAEASDNRDERDSLEEGLQGGDQGEPGPGELARKGGGAFPGGLEADPQIEVHGLLDTFVPVDGHGLLIAEALGLGGAHDPDGSASHGDEEEADVPAEARGVGSSPGEFWGLSRGLVKFSVLVPSFGFVHLHHSRTGLGYVPARSLGRSLSQEPLPLELLGALGGLLGLGTSFCRSPHQASGRLQLFDHLPIAEAAAHQLGQGGRDGGVVLHQFSVGLHHLAFLRAEGDDEIGEGGCGGDRKSVV